MHKILFNIKFISCFYMFRAPCSHRQEVKIVLYSLWYQPVQGTATYRFDDTRGCIMQFWSPDDEHMLLETCEAWNKLIVKQNFVHQVG